MRKYDPRSYHLEIGDAYTLPFEDGEFDLVLNNYMIDLLPEQDFARVLGEFFRVLRPSGRIVIVTMAFGERWYNRFWYWVARHFPSLLTNCRPVLIEKLLVPVGFIDVKAESVSQNTVPSRIITASKR